MAGTQRNVHISIVQEVQKRKNSTCTHPRKSTPPPKYRFAKSTSKAFEY